MRENMKSKNVGFKRESSMPVRAKAPVCLSVLFLLLGECRNIVHPFKVGWLVGSLKDFA